MAGNLLYGTWKIFHAKFVKPVDNALDSFSMLMLQWMLGTYNTWDVLRITCGVATSAVSYVVSVILHPSILWKEPQLVGEPVEETNASGGAGPNEPDPYDTQDCFDRREKNVEEKLSDASGQGDNNVRQRTQAAEGAA